MLLNLEAMKKDISIYVHIPFCERKCKYCAFNSFCATEHEKEEYIGLLCREIESRAKDVSQEYAVRTIYFGGGTPSVLSPQQFERVTSTIFECFDVYDNAEFTVEANPSSITPEKLEKWKQLRVNRLSIGIQTLKDKSLAQIGRLHSREMALEKLKLARKLFDNVSCDLIVGLEGQSGKQICGEAKELLSLGVKHISCYLLEVYPNTPLFHMISNGQFSPLSDEDVVATFNKLATYLQDAGMQRYEISNFAFPGYESRHNLNYWSRGEYLGFGISAHSFLHGKRTENAATVADYRDGKVTAETLSPREEDEEKIMLGLRCNLGFRLSDLKAIDLEKNPYFADYLGQGILRRSGGVVTLNPLFYHLSNTIISNLFG